MLSRHSWRLRNIKYKLSFFPSTLYFSSFTKAKAKVYNISSWSLSLSLSEVMSISSPLIWAKIDFNIVNIVFLDRVWDLGTWLSFKFLGIWCWNKFVPVVTTNCVVIALFSIIVKFYLLFRVNFIYSKLVSHEIRNNLSRVSFQHLNFMEC